MRTEFVSGKKFRSKLVRAVSFICDKKELCNLNSRISPFCGHCYLLIISLPDNIKFGIACLGDMFRRVVTKCKLTKMSQFFLTYLLHLKCVFFSSILAYMSACVDRSKQPRVNCCVQVNSLYLISTSFFLYLSIDVAHNWPPQHYMPVQYTQR